MRTEPEELDASGQRDAQHCRGRSREHDLAGPAEIADARGAVHCRTQYFAVDRDDFAGCEAGPHSNSLSAREAALHRDRRLHRVAGVRERRDRGVAFDGRAHTSTAVRFDGSVDHQLHLREQRGNSLRRAFPQLRRADDIGEQHGRDSRRSFVAPAGAQSLDQFARRCRPPCGIDREPFAQPCFQTAGYVGRDAVPPGRATSRRFTGQQREDRRRQAEDVAGAGRDATAGDLRRAKTGSSTASSRRDRHRRRSEVDEHDATGAVEDEVGRLHVTVHNAVLMQHRQRFGGLCGPPQHARRGKAGLTFVGEQLREVDAVDPVEHEHMPSLVEQVVTRVGDCRMGRKQEQCARFEQQVFSLAIDRAASDLQRDETFVTRVDGLHDRRFAAATDRLDRLVATGDTSLSHGRLECVGSLGCLECRRASRPLRRAPHSRGATDVAPGLRC